MADVSSPFGTYALTGAAAQALRWAQAMPGNWIGRRAALLLRRRAKSQAIVDASAEGLKWRIYLRDNVSERNYLFMPKFFDRIERGYLRAQLKPGDIFVDIGANIGIYTQTAAALVGETGFVLAIEPNPQALDRLKFNIALNGFGHRVLIEQSCVSDAEGAVELSLDDSNLGGSSLVAARSERRISVAAYPLLTIIQKYQLPRIDALKIDIEGAEDRALIPFFSAAPASLHPKLLLIENSAALWKGDLMAALSGAGYTLAEKTRMNLVLHK
jgi:FkbM family methyltransferase